MRCKPTVVLRGYVSEGEHFEISWPSQKGPPSKTTPTRNKRLSRGYWPLLSLSMAFFLFFFLLLFAVVCKFNWVRRSNRVTPLRFVWTLKQGKHRAIGAGFQPSIYIVRVLIQPIANFKLCWEYTFSIVGLGCPIIFFIENNVPNCHSKYAIESLSSYGKKWVNLRYDVCWL